MSRKKNYTIIDKNIKNYRNGKNKNLDIYLYGYIKLCSDFQTGISHATEKRINELTGIALRTMQSSISRLRETDLIQIETKQSGMKRHNTYHFQKDPENFYFVDNSFFHLEIDVKLKGLLLLIKSLCLNNTNITLYNRTRIAELIAQDRNTVSKMIDELIKKNMLLEIDKGFVLPANYFPIFSTKGKSKNRHEIGNDFEEFVLNSILDICREKGTVLFIPDFNPLKQIFAKYPLMESDILGLKEGQIKSCYLPMILRDKCTSLPSKIETLNSRP